MKVGIPGSSSIDGDSGQNSEIRLVDQVGERDNFTCQICGAVTKPRGDVGYIMHPLDQSHDVEDRVENHFTVCLDCFEWKDKQIVYHEVSKASRLKNAKPGFTLLYAHRLFRECIEKTRVFVHTGRFLLARRLLVVAIGSILLFGGGLTLIVTIGSLLFGLDTGQQWIQIVLQETEGILRALRGNTIVLAVLGGVGYFAHIREREQAYKRHIKRRHRRGTTMESVTHERPRWQFVAGFSLLGWVGALDWTLIQTGRFPAGSLVGAFVLWSVGALGTVIFLRSALREDRDIAGFAVWATGWVFTSRYSFCLGFIDALLTLFDFGADLSMLLWIPPTIGGIYVLRRIVERRTGWEPRTATMWLRTTVSTRFTQNRIDSEPDPDYDKKHP